MQRTEQTARRLRRALYGSEVHDGLVVGSGLAGRQQLLGQQGELFLSLGGVDGRVYAVVAGQHAINIAVDDGMGQVESHRGDGRSRIVAHALQLAYLFVGVRKAASLGYLLGGCMQIACP